MDTAAIQKVKSTKKYVNDKELESHGHSALIPTVNKPNLDNLSKDEQFIYDMIARRFLAVFLPPIVKNKTVLGNIKSVINTANIPDNKIEEA